MGEFYDFDDEDDRYFGFPDFLKFHRENPGIYTLMLGFAREFHTMREKERCSIWLIANRVRWEVYVTTTDPDFKIPNGTFAYYARLIMRRNPELEGFFRTKALRGGEPPWDTTDL